MADNNPIIDFGTAPRDLQLLIDRLKLADGIIVKISQDALTAGRNLSSIQLPSDLAQFTAQNQQLTTQIQAQAQALSQLQTQYNSLVNSRRGSSQQTAEEAVNQRILNRNAMEAARINSTLAGAYQRLVTQQTQAARAVQNLISAGRQATQTQREYDSELRVAQREFDRLNARVVAADRAVGRFQRNVGNYSNSIIKSAKEILAAFGLVAGAQLIANLAKDIFQTTKEIQSMDMALLQVTGSSQKFAETQMFLSRIAEAYGADLGKLTQQFTQFYVSAKDKISGTQIENIFESITKAAATMGLSTQQQERAFMALNQMMSKGTIQAEELRGQLGEALPGALGIMAKAVGVSEKRLAEMMKAGQLLAADVLPKFADQLEKTYGIENVNRIENLATAQGRYTNAWRDFVRGLDEDGNKVSKFMINLANLGTDLLIGAKRIAESDQATRNRILKTLQENGYNQTLAYYNSLEELKNEDLENDKAYTYAKIKEEEKEFNRLKNRNLILKAITKKGRDDWGNLDPGIAEMAKNAKAMNEINNLLSRRKGQYEALNKLLGDNNKVTTKSTELTKDQLKAIEDALRAKYDAARKELELQALKQEVILNGEYATYEEQNKALEKFLDLRIQIIKLDYNEQVRLAKGNADKIKIADLDMQMAMIKQAQDGFSKTKAIRKKQNDEYISEIKDVEDFLKKYHEDEELRIESQQEVEEKVAAANKKLIDDKIEKLKQLKQATKDYTDSFIEEFAGNMGMSETFDTFLKTFDDGTGKMTTKFEQLLKGADSPMKKFQVYFNSIAESAQEAFNFIDQASQKNFDAEKNRLQKQYDVAVGFAGDSAEAKKKLDEDLEKRQKEIAYREAKAKKQQALFNIAIDTAQAVVAALPNYILAGIIAAFGVAQAIAVNSQEIPQYWMGGTHDGGLMMVNDGSGSNYRETIVTPDGKIMQPTGRNVIMDAPAGTEIFTHDQWQNTLSDMLKGKGIEMHRPNAGSNGLSKSDMKDVLMETIGSQSQSLINFDENGITQSFINKGNKTTAYTKRGNSTKLRFG